MNSQSILRALKNRKTDFCSGLARTTGMTEGETIKVLLSLEQEGLLAQKNGYWWLTPSGEKKAR